MWLKIFRKILRNLLLVKLYESKNVNVRVIAHHIFRPWKEDVLVDIDAFYKYKQFSVSIWPQSQITKTTLFYNVISCEAFITKTSPMFVLKGKYTKSYPYLRPLGQLGNIRLNISSISSFAWNSLRVLLGREEQSISSISSVAKNSSISWPP